jgi:hypothetical protein
MSGTTPPRLDRQIRIWTIYERPRDYPQGFIARLRVIEAGRISAPVGEPICGPTLQSVRDQLPKGLIPLSRDPLDESHIVESWI